MKYQGYLIDLDGTMFRGDKPIDTAVDFVRELDQLDMPYLFVTNNSAKTPEHIAEKLTNMNIPATPDHVFTSSMATAQYVHDQTENPRCYMIGEEGLEEALTRQNTILTDTDCDFVIIGLDRNIAYEKFVTACNNVRKGATFLATNADLNRPTEQGLLPGNGAFASVITTSTGVEPIVIGKPETIMMKAALTMLGTAKEETLMIGDNYDTDIQAGINAGIDTLMVATGVSNYEDIPNSSEKPTYYAENLSEWMEQK